MGLIIKMKKIDKYFFHDFKLSFIKIKYNNPKNITTKAILDADENNNITKKKPNTEQSKENPFLKNLFKINNIQIEQCRPTVLEFNDRTEARF